MDYFGMIMNLKTVVGLAGVENIRNSKGGRVAAFVCCSTIIRPDAVASSDFSLLLGIRLIFGFRSFVAALHNLP